MAISLILMMSKNSCILFELFNGRETYSHERVTIGPLRKKEHLIIPPDYVVPKIEPQYVITADARNQLDMRYSFQIAYLNTQEFQDELKNDGKRHSVSIINAFIVFLLNRKNNLKNLVKENKKVFL